MKALSIRQPWAWLICAGIPLTEAVDLGGGRSTVKFSNKAILKDIENRDWPLPRDFELPQRIYVHAPKTVDGDAMYWLMKMGFAPMMVMMLYSDKIPKGCIIGEVDIVDCVTESQSPWFLGPYGFVLANPVIYKEPIPYKGQLGFFEVSLAI